MAEDDNPCCKLVSGPAFFFLGIYLLIYNEFRYVRQTASIDFGESNAQKAGCDCDNFLDGSLVFLSCEVTKLPQITDAPALKSIRRLLADKDEDQGTDMLVEVDIFQTVRHESRRRGSRVTYPKKWVKSPKPGVCKHTSWFDDESCEENVGSLPSNLETVQVQASDGSVWIGERTDPNSGYYLKRDDIRQVTRVPRQELFVRQADRYDEPQDQWDARQGGRVSEHNLFTNGNTLQTYPPDGKPSIGDIRAEFQLVKPKIVSIMARQTRPWQTIDLMQHKSYLHGTGFDHGDVLGNVQQYPGGQVEHPECTFESHETVGGYDIDWLLDGHYTFEKFIAHMRSENSMLLWILRFLGWAAMVVGVCTFVSAGFEICQFTSLGCFCFNANGGAACVGCISGILIATPLTILIIGVAWLGAHPLIGISLIALALVTGGAVLNGKISRTASGREVHVTVEDVEGEASHYKQIPEQMKM